VRRDISALLSHYSATPFFKVISLLANGSSILLPGCYNFRMIKPLAEAIKIIRDLPEDEQDTIAHRLMRLIDLAQSTHMELASASGAGLS
jgi:hypothetical protein